MTTSNKDQKLPDVPIEYAGQWVAWNDEWTQIVAHGVDIAEVSESARRLVVRALARSGSANGLANGLKPALRTPHAVSCAYAQSGLARPHGGWA